MTPSTIARSPSGSRAGDALRARLSGQRRRLPQTPLARRVSGPSAAPKGPRKPVTASQRVRSLPDAPILERLTRGRLWIPIIAVGLLGIVFMQVTMLSLNAKIGRDVDRTAVLQRENAVLSASVAKEDTGNRVEDAAKDDGMIEPPTDSLRYVAPDASASKAAKSITTPQEPVAPGSTSLPQSPTAPAGTSPAAVAQTPAPASTPATTPSTGGTASSGAPAPSTGGTTPPTAVAQTPTPTPMQTPPPTAAAAAAGGATAP